jgi:hypothetical protein
MAITENEKRAILDAARATIARKLDFGAHDEDDGLARWESLQKKAHREPEPEGGAPMPEPEPAPAPVPVINSEAWNAWWRANYATAQAKQSELTPFMNVLWGEVLAHERNEYEKALAQERRRSEKAINELRSEMTRLVRDTLVHIEGVVTADRVARGIGRDAAAAPPDKALN